MEYLEPRDLKYLSSLLISFGMIDYKIKGSIKRDTILVSIYVKWKTMK